MYDKPYCERLFEAVMAQDADAIESIIQDCFVQMTHGFMGVVTGYDYNDLPIVVAVMKVMERTLEMTLDETGKEFVQMISNRTSSVAIDLDELRRQAKEAHENGEKDE